jgi:hypothetical protein
VGDELDLSVSNGRHSHFRFCSSGVLVFKPEASSCIASSRVEESKMSLRIIEHEHQIIQLSSTRPTEQGNGKGAIVRLGFELSAKLTVGHCLQIFAPLGFGFSVLGALNFELRVGVVCRV